MSGHLLGFGSTSALEPRATRAGCVIVLGRWAVSLLALVVTGKPELGEGAKEEEEPGHIFSLGYNGFEIGSTYAPMTATAKQTLLRRHAKP